MPATTMDFEGNVISGMGEGAYYTCHWRAIGDNSEKIRDMSRNAPGTLNVRLTDQIYMNGRLELGKHPSIFINGFSDGTHTTAGSSAIVRP